MKTLTFICISISTLALIGAVLLAWLMSIVSGSISEVKFDQLIMYFIRFIAVFAIFSLISTSLTYNRK